MNSHLTADSEQGHQLVDVMVQGVVESVALDMRGQPASMVLEMLRETLSRRLPGIAVEHEILRDVAARIAVGLPPL